MMAALQQELGLAVTVAVTTTRSKEKSTLRKNDPWGKMIRSWVAQVVDVDTDVW